MYKKLDLHKYDKHCDLVTHVVLFSSNANRYIVYCTQIFTIIIVKWDATCERKTHCKCNYLCAHIIYSEKNDSAFLIFNWQYSQYWKCFEMKVFWQVLPPELVIEISFLTRFRMRSGCYILRDLLNQSDNGD